MKLRLPIQLDQKAELKLGAITNPQLQAHGVCDLQISSCPMYGNCNGKLSFADTAHATCSYMGTRQLTHTFILSSPLVGGGGGHVHVTVDKPTTVRKQNKNYHMVFECVKQFMKVCVYYIVYLQ